MSERGAIYSFKILIMERLKYTVIESDAQYFKYCDILEGLVFSGKKKPKHIQQEIDLLTLLIEKYDDQQREFELMDPVELLCAFMQDHNMKAKDVAELLGVTKGYVSAIVNYKKGFSKMVTRKLAERFKVRQDAFNRPYELEGLKKDKRKKAA